MGSYFSKIGSDPYYANYEKSFQRLKTDIDKLKVRALVLCMPTQQQLHLQTLSISVFMHVVAGQAASQAATAEQDRADYHILGSGHFCSYCAVCCLGMLTGHC